jgi:nicotinamidase-related amidase
VLAKHRVNAFVGTALDTLLRTYGVTNVAVAGCSTDVGVPEGRRVGRPIRHRCRGNW